MQRLFAKSLCKLYGHAMTEETRAFRVTDERALNALAHPLRSRLVVLLRADGPATATRLAERVHESSGVTSYHLRRLADVGVVEEVRDRGTKRERWWRSVYDTTQWTAADFLGDRSAHQTTVSWRREVYRWQWRLLEQWLSEEGDWDKSWVDAASNDDALLELTPESLKSMSEEIWEVVQRYRNQQPPAGAADKARVVWLQHLIPVRGELPL
jgi:DNA-binding transcriptional ArsR family regulator